MVKSALKWMGALALVALVASSPLAHAQEPVGIVEGDDYENAMMPEPVLEDEPTFVEEEVPMYSEEEEPELPEEEDFVPEEVPAPEEPIVADEPAPIAEEDPVVVDPTEEPE